MIEEFDLVIIGAGPAGAAAAVMARKAGLSVALIDKACFPRGKLCGGLVSGRSLKALDRILGTRPPRNIFQISRAVRFAWAGKALAVFDAPHDLWFTMRRDFDQVLFNAACTAGAVDFSGRRWDVLETGAGQITLEDGACLGFRALIAADGVTSPVAAQLFGRAFDPDLIGFALEAESARNPEKPAVMAVDFAAVKWGYGWSFPKNNSQTIGVGGLKAHNPDLRTSLEVLLPENDNENIKGAFLPFGDFRRKPGKKNILLTGDAAGLVDPLTGEGIAYALESGELAARVVVDAIANGQPEKAAKSYKRALKPLHTELSRANKLRQIAFSPRFEAVFREKLQNSPRLRQVFFDLLEGKAGYRDIEKRIARELTQMLGKGRTG